MPPGAAGRASAVEAPGVVAIYRLARRRTTGQLAMLPMPSGAADAAPAADVPWLISAHAGADVQVLMLVLMYVQVAAGDQCRKPVRAGAWTRQRQDAQRHGL